MDSSRRAFLKNFSFLGTFSFADISMLENLKMQQPLSLDNTPSYGNLIEAPEDSAHWPAFRRELERWRAAKKKEINYSGETYADSRYQWSQSNFNCGFLMMYDLDFYDPKKNEYTPDKIISRGIKEFGGYDSVVLWHAYPRIGIDERNQFDFYRHMPGGLQGVRTVVKRFHEKDIKVFINYNPWDTGTKRELKPDIDSLIDIIVAINADGIFLDTMKEGGPDFREKLDKARPGIVLEGELAAELDVLSTHHQSWAQSFRDRYVPGIIRDKWFERRHIQHQIERWSADHSSELHEAWMNGSGMMIWENVFGQWVGWNERDKSILRTITSIQRRYNRLFIGERWTPLVETRIEGVFASLWEDDNIRLWTLINRHDKAVSGTLMTVEVSAGHNYYDLVSGKQAGIEQNEGSILLNGQISARSIGCFVSGSQNDLGKDFSTFLTSMGVLRRRYMESKSYPAIITTLKKVEPTPTSKDKLDNMAELPPITFLQYSEVHTRECGAYEGAPGKRMITPQRFNFSQFVHIPHIAIDITPVTNKQYFEFLQATNFQPKVTTNFLLHWNGDTYPAGKEDYPVVFVDLDDARAYATWAGKRLPREEEWQLAAQGYEKLNYPWGNELKTNYYNNGNDLTSVYAYPKGKSPFGCLDMCSNAWEMTESEYSDGHNRFCMLKGGSYFRAMGSHWYAPGGPQPSTTSVKFLMLYPGIDRCSTIGFRCVKDLI